MSVNIKVRVFLRSRIGTTIVWNTDALNQDQREHYQVQIQRKGMFDWTRVEVVQPPAHSIQKIVADGKTMALMIPNLQNNLSESDEFLIKLIVGKETPEEVIVEVQEQHKPFVKARRIEMGNGEVVYAEPAIIVAIAPSVANDIASAVKRAIMDTKDK